LINARFCARLVVLLQRRWQIVSQIKAGKSAFSFEIVDVIFIKVID
jgi:hypothetical protein